MEPNKLADYMRMLREAGMGPFAKMHDDRSKQKQIVTLEIRYHIPQAEDVLFIWGIDGWASVQENLRPAGTTVKKSVMHTPMIKENNSFVVKIHVPYGSTIDYGFLITKKHIGITTNIWDGKSDQDYHTVAIENGLIEVKTNVVLQGH